MALTDNDEDGAKKPPALKPLEPLSIAELETYIETLESEIARARRAIETKRSIRGGAESIFRR
jgi:uncharacterized small protein (DUF1192 family)